MPATSQPSRQQLEQSRQAVAEELRGLGVGQVHFDRHHQMLYATDASIYQVEPIGVVVPDSTESIRRLVEHCGRRGIAMLPRGGGTSLAGQCVNRAVVVAYSATCRRVLGIDSAGRTCDVEPGITVDELNRELESAGTNLFFAPDPATAAQASIGGCIGNNAAGARSVRYGRTSENVAALDVVLSDGRRMWLGRGAGRRDPAARSLAEDVAAIVRRYAEDIRARFPRTSRRNAGYALDGVLQQLESGVPAEDLDLAGLICGSEGTLAVVLNARLKLHPVPRSKGLAIVSFATLEEALAAVPACLSTGACAVELLDDVVLTAARGNRVCRGYLDLLPLLPGGPASAVLYVEYQEVGDMEQVRARFAALRQAMGDAPLATYEDRTALLRAWALRKAGEPLLHGMGGHRKPVTCVEDNAVPVENLARFVAGFKQIVQRHGTRAAYWAHAAVGVLHVRPMLDLHDPADRDRLRSIAVEVADWARECGGVMSGEHGDGRIRGPLLQRFFGPALMQAFAEIKRVFDPAGVLNPGIIVNAGDVPSITQHLRVLPDHRPIQFPQVQTFFSYDDQEGFDGAVEMCNGAGVCRKTAGGTMCPSYRATLDERHSTRGRGNALRLAISGQLGTGDGKPAWNDRGTMQTLSLCLSCKACKSECPSNVDVARLKAEYLAQSYRVSGAPLAARVFGHVRRLNQMIGAVAPRLMNWLMDRRPIRALMNRLLELAPQRKLPRYHRSLFRWFDSRTAPIGTGPTVVLFADCFVTYNEPHIGQAAVRTLEKLGYQVALPKVGCCGRSMISTGLLADAIKSADTVLQQLRPFIDDPQVPAIVVCEPSCLSAMKDDWLQLKLKTDIDLRRRLADKAMLAEEFVERFWDQHPNRPRIQHGNTTALVHGHCHPKALWGQQQSTAALRRVFGERVTVLDSGCCGMAGAFGYDAEKYGVSMQIGELSLFPAVRSASADATIIAAGTSCRHQIADGTGRRALHPIELIWQTLEDGAY